MARYPEPGRVKTRMACGLGAVRAAELYRAFLLDIEHRFAAGPRPLVWMYEPPDSPFASLLTPGSCCLAQSGESLGQRMRHCFETLMGTGEDEVGFDRVIMIGSDVPHVRDACIEEADARLSEYDVALGPSDDGGYYLIALRRPVDLFSMIEMGTAHVLEQTLDLARHTGLRVHLLPADFDVDHEADLERLREVIRQNGRAYLPHTAAVLNGIGQGDR
jgi:rSAM/selenodomain-associated transferase 1